jgi:hypothetical protein
VSAANELPIEVRRACWARLWEILLREPCTEEAEQRESESSREPGGTNGAGARVALGKEVKMVLT